jgi:hypothetical protein
MTSIIRKKKNGVLNSDGEGKKGMAGSRLWPGSPERQERELAETARETQRNQALKFRETLWCVLRLKSIKYLIKALMFNFGGPFWHFSMHSWSDVNCNSSVIPPISTANVVQCMLH